MNIDSYLQSSSINQTLLNSQTNAVEETTEGSESFLETLMQKLDEVNDKQIESENTTQAFIQGDDIDIHEVMIASEEATLSLQMAVQVRNKVVEAYQELNRMQL